MRPMKLKRWCQRHQHHPGRHPWRPGRRPRSATAPAVSAAPLPALRGVPLRRPRSTITLVVSRTRRSVDIDPLPIVLHGRAGVDDARSTAPPPGVALGLLSGEGSELAETGHVHLSVELAPLSATARVTRKSVTAWFARAGLRSPARSMRQNDRDRSAAMARCRRDVSPTSRTSGRPRSALCGSQSSPSRASARLPHRRTRTSNTTPGQARCRWRHRDAVDRTHERALRPRPGSKRRRNSPSPVLGPDFHIL